MTILRSLFYILSGLLRGTLVHHQPATPRRFRCCACGALADLQYSYPVHRDDGAAEDETSIVWISYRPQRRCKWYCRSCAVLEAEQLKEAGEMEHAALLHAALEEHDKKTK